MQRKPSYPVTNCSIKMPDCPPNMDITASEDDNEQQQRRQQLINFGHSQWGFNNWSWSVTKQELDFVDFANGKYCAGVVAFVSITLKTLDIHRENIGYATSNANTKGLAIYKSRKCAVTNALRETLLSFGGNVATELLELIEVARNDVTVVNAPVTSLPDPAHQVENNQNIINRLPEPKTSPVAMLPRKDEPRNLAGPPVARAHPMPASLPVRPPGPPGPPAVAAVAGAPLTAGRLAVPPGGAGAGAAVAGPAALRPNSNVSFVLQPVVGGLYAPRLAGGLAAGAAPLFPEYYSCAAAPWHFACEPCPPCPPCERPPGAACPPRAPPCRAPADDASRGCWIKPTIFYDGFWTEQKVKKWVAEQVEKRFPGDSSPKSSSPGGGAGGA